MCQANSENIMVIKGILQVFDPALELEINFYKTKLRGIGVEQIMLQRFPAMFNCS